MADDVFGVEVVTPEQSLVAGGATSVVLATSEGALTVLDGHTPLVGDVVPGLVKVDLADGTHAPPGRARRLRPGRHQSRRGRGPGRGRRPAARALDPGHACWPAMAELAEEIDVPRAERASEVAAQRVAELASGRGGSSEQPGARRGPRRWPCVRPKRRWAGPSSG